jgi:hypothetical protein
MENKMCSILDRKNAFTIFPPKPDDSPASVAFFYKPKWTELAIAHEINRLLGENNVSRSTLGKYVRMFVLSMKETDAPVVPESDDDFSFDDRIILILSKEPFLSVGQIAKKVMMSKSTGYCNLAQTMR